MKRFLLVRAEDPSGVSGPGIVADGVLWGNGRVTLQWRLVPCESSWDSLAGMLHVHGHEGKTKPQWIDT